MKSKNVFPKMNPTSTTVLSILLFHPYFAGDNTDSTYSQPCLTMKYSHFKTESTSVWKSLTPFNIMSCTSYENYSHIEPVEKESVDSFHFPLMIIYFNLLLFNQVWSSKTYNKGRDVTNSLWPTCCALLHIIPVIPKNFFCGLIIWDNCEIRRGAGQ